MTRITGTSGTAIKDTWTKPREDGMGGEVGMAGVGGVVGRKGRQLYLNNNRKNKNKDLSK